MTTLASLPGWDAAVGRLLALNDAHGAVARTRAQRYAETYAGRRAAMVFDVVASRQRDYLKRVLPMVARFEQAEESTLRGLSVEGVRGTYGLRVGEAETMRAVASGLARYCDERGIDE